ncbi:Uncharacterised protein [Klebsiella michiganensis]|uniref:SnoaL-like domain-containing protein n=1 Tax=Klebsiella michiganensis TaxID=1134687 RepID=A0A7H4MZM4_9ENTR|nr:Uncharacterised protein [Klebsiella michiganensis]
MLKKSIVAFSLFCALTPPFLRGNSENEQLNKKNVIDFYNKALNDKDFAAARPYLGDRYVQHNPMAKDGVAGFEQFIAFLKNKYPDSHSEI